MRGSVRVRTSTSRANTTAAAGAPPITDACAPSSAIVSSPSLSRREKTTNAPPWKREMTQNAIGPSKLTIARPISAPYSSWSRRIDSGDPSKPARFASTTSGRRPDAALIARASFLEAAGNSVPDVHCSGPSAGTAPKRGSGRDSMPEQRHRPAAQAGVPGDGDLRLAHPGPALERLAVAVDHRAHHRADVERLLAARVGLLGEDLARRSADRSRAPRAARCETSRSTGSSLSPRRGKRSPGATYVCS